MVEKDGNMTIYNVMPEDGGVFQCELGGSNSSLIILEVVDIEEPYRVVKGPESRGPHASPPEVYKGVESFSMWSPWTECSVCGEIGRKRRYGMCYVKLDPKMMENHTRKTVEIEDFVKLDDNDIGLFKIFPDGIPCRSQYLPPPIKLMNIGQQRPSEIMIAMCKVSCQDISLARVPSRDNKTMRTDAVLLYSLNEVLPKQPPLAARDTIYADFGRPITIRCPGYGCFT
ncbi:Ig-like V-type domain-containing protein FAM187A [Trichoplusia ni]|uniref:Ig-like V-type domain-containing protein FAM187A n=1 Tax=Trichoplusia ni TaxID=7111 RepID=A0A7E5WFV5_TRINI|nr:Ig-like V-type domain-containing protein FAM187A [Trichoplusia ni]